MNRRQLLQLSMMAALAPAGPLSAAPAPPTGSKKKGLCIAAKTPDWSKKLQDLKCKWLYNWTAKSPAGLPDGVNFTPMIWGSKGQKVAIMNAAAAAKTAGTQELLGFNEPDQSSQSNISVETALAAWPALMETGLRLGSPGCVHPDREWMKAFMAGAKSRDLKVDFVCVHSYGSPSATAFLKRMNEVYQLYKKPIWITEFAVGDWDAPSVDKNQFKPDAVLRFMEELLPKLDQLDFIERYAWFPAKADNKALGTSTLFDESGTLTRLGECYRDA